MPAGVKVQECASNTWGAIISKHHPIAQLTASHDGRDKIIKFVVAFFDIVVAALKRSGNIDPQTVEGLQGTQDALKLTRTVTGLLNAVGNTPGRLNESITKICYLFLDIINPHELTPHESVRRAQLGILPTDGYDTNFKRALGITREGFNILASLAFLGGFGITRPIQFAGKYFKNLGETTKQIGAKFAYFMVSLHLANIVASSVNSIRLIIHFELSADNLIPFLSAIKTDLLNLVENGCDLALDVVGIFKYSVPEAVPLTLGFIIASIGLYNAWDAACETSKEKYEKIAAKQADLFEKYEGGTKNSNTSNHSNNLHEEN